MDLIILVVMLVLVGFIVWLLTTYIPMPPEWAKTIQIIALVIMIVYVITRLFNVPNLLR